jgi:hypothetical protein
MKTVQKVLVSLLLATLAFTAFAVVAYSGLFSIIDARFYSQRIRSTSQVILGEAEELIDDYLLRLQQDVGSLAADPAIGNVFLVNQSRDDIERQQRLVATLLEARSEIDYLRIIDSEEGQLWFSTLETDIRTQTDVRVEYRSIGELDPPVLLPQAREEGNRSDWIPERSALRVTVPVVDRFSIPRGVLTAWVGTSGIYARLVDEGIIGPSQRVRLTPGGFLVVNAPRHLSGDDLLAVDQAMAVESASPIIDSSIGSGFALEQRMPGDGSPPLVWMISESQMTMDMPLRIILLASVFLLTFIIVYLILNIRQDPTVVVAERFRRFQESVVKDYLREGRVVDPEIWRRELETRKDRIEREIQRGLGKVKDEAREHLEQTMQRNWDELYRLLGTRDGGQRAELEPVSLRQIEEIIERTLSRYGETMPSSPGRSASESPRTVSPRREVPPEQSQPSIQEAGEITRPTEKPSSPRPSAEPLEDLEELDEDVSAPEPVDVEELDEGAEAEELSEVEELEELDELEELEDADAGLVEAEEPAELAELDDAAEAEELSEVEELEELDELEELEDADAEPVEAEELGEAEAPAEVAELAELDEGAEAEELSEVEELEELDELAELEDADAEAVEAEEPAEAEAPAEVAGLAELDEGAEAEELSEVEELEELDELEELEDADAEAVEAEEPAEAEAPAEVAGLAELDEGAEAEELSEVEELEELDELEELEDADAEPVEAEELGEAEAPAEVAGLAELDDAAEAEELSEVEELEELDELEELEDADAEAG